MQNVCCIYNNRSGPRLRRFVFEVVRLSVHNSPAWMSASVPANWARTARTLTEAAARACMPWIGAGDKEAADAAAVEALRTTAADGTLHGRVVIGEGEKDNAPYLAPGESIGPTHEPPTVDVAVDPLEGTRLAANGEPGALAVLALAPAGSIVPLGRAFYMQKLIGPPAARGALSLDASHAGVVTEVAAALGSTVSDLCIAVQERPRHTALVEAIRETGASRPSFRRRRPQLCDRGASAAHRMPR